MKKLIVISMLLFSGVLQANNKPPVLTSEIQPSVFSLTLVMMHDVVNPPAAARYYAYCTLGAYAIVAQHNSDIVPPSAYVKSFPAIHISANNGEYDYQTAAVYCIYESGRLLLPSGFMLEEKQQKFLQLLKKKKLSRNVIEKSIAVAKEVAQQVVEFSKGDHYNKLSSMLRYTPLKGEEFWYPTPPGYMEAIEPNWKSIRTLIMDSCNEFVPNPPVPFSKDSSSAFYKMIKEVYDVGKNPTEEQRTIAGFWDCNPFAISSAGHMMLGFKKMSPGGHWMNIAAIAAETAGLDFDRSIVVQAVTGITLMDAFISCWDEKFRSNRIRPETFINRYMDPKWQPILQTPPFPEYTSGHSVISTAAAEVLTYLLGDNFSFTDDSEVMFELNPRSFTSFRQACNEAAISRLYGGIHYRDAIEEGQTQGRGVGGKVISVLKKAGVKPLR